MKQELSTVDQKELMINMAQMVTEVDVGRQCGNIARWLKKHLPVQGIGFSLKEPGSSQPYLHMEEIPTDTIEIFQGILTELDFSKTAADEFMVFSWDEGKPTIFDPKEHPPSSKPIVLTSQLNAKETLLGSLALVTDLEAVQHLTGEKSPLPWLTTMISSLLYNAISQKQNAEKIRFLRLYQTVSSALGYVGDLQELLTTIVSIVTAELPSEEGSVLLHDEETNELEFFTAVGETGAELVKLRFPADKGIAGRALRERMTIVVNDVQSSPDFYGSIDEDHGFQTKSILAAPLISGDETVGVLNAINKIGKEGFDEEDKRLLTAIADEVALAIKNARLFDFVVDSYCKIRQGLNSCKGCKRPLKSWTPCAIQLGKLQ
ncbi:MAG: GAF domain-containing protein [Deltaproteobacteria bacterium]|nr:MAG: GAF domain-containing protein [Deltaproteobacteria bacterium]